MNKKITLEMFYDALNQFDFKDRCDLESYIIEMNNKEREEIKLSKSA